MWLAVFFGKVCRLGCSEKVYILSPFLCSCQQPGIPFQGFHFHVNNSLLVPAFLLFLMLLEDRFCGFVLVTHLVYMHNTYMKECCFSSWAQTFCLYVQSVASGWTCDGGSTSTSLQALLGRDVRRSGCHHVFVQQSPSSCTTGRGWLWIDLHMRNGSASPLVADCNASVASP